MKAYSFLDGNEKEAVMQQFFLGVSNTARESLWDYYKIVVVAHIFFFENNWPIKCTSKTKKLVPYVVDMINNNNKQTKQRFLKYIKGNGRCTIAQTPLLYRMDIFEKQVLSTRLISIYQLLNAKNRDNYEITNQISTIFSILLRLMPDQFTDMFTSYFINNTDIIGVNTITYNKCICTKMMLSAGNETEKFTVRSVIHSGQNDLFLSNQQMVNYCIKTYTQWRGKNKKNWIYDYV